MSSLDKEIESPFQIKVFHISNDETSKTFGEILKNKSSRGLIETLKEKQMYVNEIHKKQEMRVSLVSYHLNKLIELGFLNITKKPISRKTKEHRYFDTKHDAYLILIDKEEGVEEVHKYSILKKIFKPTVKFASVCFAGVATWFGINTSDGRYFSTDLALPIIITMMVVGFGLIMIYCSKKHK